MIRICGPKFSMCCSILSVWGIIMLVIMGIFLFTHSVAFAEDPGNRGGTHEEARVLDRGQPAVHSGGVQLLDCGLLVCRDTGSFCAPDLHEQKGTARLLEM
ncbi:hypothetical protein MRX96_045844 [Rhipicephalus microplus]